MLPQYQQELKFFGLSLKAIAVNHSIPDTYGVVVSDESHAIVYISDFKYDENSIEEKPFNTALLNSYLSKFNSRMAMLDSTNILNDGKTPSESELLPSFEELIKKDQRVFITLFASNIHRIKSLLKLAIKHEKKV